MSDGGPAPDGAPAPASKRRPLWRRIAGRARISVSANVNGARFLAVGPTPGEARWVYLGDSHAVHAVETEFPSPRVGFRDRSTTALYIGPRLLHSVAVAGWPAWVTRLLTVLRHLPGRRSSTPTNLVVMLGEIDVRCHLARDDRRSGIAELARRSVERVEELRPNLPPGSLMIICTPLPPSRRYASAEQFPVVGSVAERLEVLDQLCVALHDAVHAAGRDDLVLFDPRPLVADDDGELRAELTFDGCHLDTTGAAMLREALAVFARTAVGDRPV